MYLIKSTACRLVKYCLYKKICINNKNHKRISINLEKIKMNHPYAVDYFLTNYVFILNIKILKVFKLVVEVK